MSPNDGIQKHRRFLIKTETVEHLTSMAEHAISLRTLSICLLAKIRLIRHSPKLMKISKNKTMLLSARKSTNLKLATKCDFQPNSYKENIRTIGNQANLRRWDSTCLPLFFPFHALFRFNDVMF